MSRISPTLLNDTYTLVALARQAALERGMQNQAEQLAPVEKQLRTLASDARESLPPVSGPSVGGQTDFQALLNAARKPAEGEAAQAASAVSNTFNQDRNQIVTAMASGGMPDVEIARQLGVSREEVRLVLSLNRFRGGEQEVSA